MGSGVTRFRGRSHIGDAQQQPGVGALCYIYIYIRLGWHNPQKVQVRACKTQAINQGDLNAICLSILFVELYIFGAASLGVGTTTWLLLERTPRMSISDITPVQDATDFSVDDLQNPRSVISLTRNIPTFQDAIKRLLQEAPDYLDLEYTELKVKANPTYTLFRVRTSFWNEYENAIQHNRSMHLSNMYAGVCTERLFRKKVLTDNLKLAFILSPPKDYTITVKEALDAGLDNLRAIATAPILTDSGKLDTKAAEVVLKAIALLDMRVKGAVVQRIDQRSLNVNLNKDVSPASSEGQLTLPQDLSELDKQIERLKAKLITQVTRVKLPSQPEEIMQTMRDLNTRIIDVGGSKARRDNND
jgi:hypothetical protein